MFCPKCGSILMPKQIEEKVKVEPKEPAKTATGKKKKAPVKKTKVVKKKVMACPKCGERPDEVGSTVIKEDIIKEGPELEIVDGDEENLPLTDIECPKCHHLKAYYWMVQTRASDEPETKFLKCEKCKHTWRDYD